MRDQPPAPALQRDAAAHDREGDRVGGILFVVKDGYGFLRQPKNSYLSGPGDVYVPKNVIQRWRIRAGSEVQGVLGRGRRGKKKRPLEVVSSVNGRPPEEHARSRQWKDLGSSEPDRRLRLETKANDLTLRTIELVAPIGLGHRVVVFAPPRTGKTTLLQKVVNAVAENHPSARVMVLLVDERPEKVTDWRRSCPKAEVVASTLEQDPADHVTVAEVVLDRSKRLVESGRDVVLVVDSFTRLARAFNAERGRSGRTLTGGLDPTSLQKPREIFAAARSIDRGGSLTVIAGLLAESDTKLDQAIEGEFKGAGAVEITLSPELVRKRIFPAIDMKASGTRREERVRDGDEQRLVNLMKRQISRYTVQQSIEWLLEKLRASQNNAEFLLSLPKSIM